METDGKARADARIEAAFAEAQVVDSRAALRERLRDLRGRAPEAFERALAHYEAIVLPALADGGDAHAALDAWIDYGRFVGALDGSGQTLAIDGSGRAAAYTPPLEGRLAVFLPDDAARPALLLASPLRPTAAQAAALGLLIEARLTL